MELIATERENKISSFYTFSICPCVQVYLPRYGACVVLIGLHLVGIEQSDNIRLELFIKNMLLRVQLNA